MSDLERLSQMIVEVEDEVEAKLLAARLALDDLLAAKARRNRVHEEYRVAFVADEELRKARAC